MSSESHSCEVGGREFPAVVAQAFEPLIATVPEEKRRLGGFILLALIVHAVAFAFLQVIQVQPFITRTPRIAVSLATPELASPEMRANLDYWSKIHDPSLLIIPGDPLLEDVSVAHSFGGPAPGTEWDLLAAADDASTVTYDILPRQQAPLADRVAGSLTAPPAQTFRPPAIAPAEAAGNATVITFDDALRDRVVGSGPRLPDATVASLTPERGTTDLRVAVGQDGRVRYVLVEDGSGSDAIDNRAANALRQTRFRRIDTPGLTWGNVRVYWHFTSPEAKAE